MSEAQRRPSGSLPPPGFAKSPNPRMNGAAPHRVRPPHVVPNPIHEELTPASLARRFAPEPDLEPRGPAEPLPVEPHVRAGTARWSAERFPDLSRRLQDLAHNRTALAGLVVVLALLPSAVIIGLVALGGTGASDGAPEASPPQQLAAAPQGLPAAPRQAAAPPIQPAGSLPGASPEQAPMAAPPSTAPMQAVASDPVPPAPAATTTPAALDTPQLSKAAQSPAAPAPAAPPVTPVLTSAPVLHVTAGASAAFPIAIDGTDGMPPRSAVAISGLPHDASFSAGRPFGDGQWNLRADETGDLAITLPADAVGAHAINLQLIGPTGTVLASSKTTLLVDPAAHDPAAQMAAASKPPLEHASQPMPVKKPPVEHAAKAAAANTADVKSGRWVVINTDVKLHKKGASSSASIAVMKKGTRMTVSAKRYGWLEVTDPSRHLTGWVYGRFATPTH